MKRELKDREVLIKNIFDDAIAKVIPMKRELKGVGDDAWVVGDASQR